MGFVPLQMPEMIAYTEGEALYPELWDKLRGCWVPGLFAGPIWDFSESKDGANIDSPERTKATAIRTGVQSGEEFDGVNDYVSITMSQISSTRPENGWTLVIKLRRYINTPGATAQAGLGHWGATGNSTLYPWTDGNLYISLLGNTRIMNGVANSFDRTKWHDLTVTSISEGSSIDWNCFQAGLKIGTGTPGSWFFDTANDQRIGANKGGPPSEFFHGQIRHVLLYNRILDLDTIQRLDNDPLYTPYTGIDSLAFKTPTSPTLDTLTLDADGTIDAVIENDLGDTPVFDHGNDEPDGVSSDYFQNDNSETSGFGWFSLTNTNSDFLSMDTFNGDFDAQAVGFSNDTCTLTARIFAADNDTGNPLTDETSNIITHLDSIRIQPNIEFTGLTGTKAQWDAAYIRYTWTYNKTGGPDNANLRLFGCKFNGTYIAEAPAGPVSGPPLRSFTRLHLPKLIGY